MEETLQRDERCFCCGKDNDRGLHLPIEYPAEGVAETTFTIPEHFTGWRRMSHGGLLSMVLDELMAHACISAGSRAVTAELAVRFVRPAEVGSVVRVVGRVAGRRGRLLDTAAELTDLSGSTIAHATGRFIPR